MGATAAVHPADPILQAYGLGKLDDVSSASVSKHLEGLRFLPAARCRAVVRRFPGTPPTRPGHAGQRGLGLVTVRYVID